MYHRTESRLGRPRRAVWYAAVAGLLVTAVIVALTGRGLASSLDIRLDRLGTEVLGSLDDSLQQGLDRAQALAGLIEASDEVTAGEFARFARQIGPGRSVVMAGFVLNGDSGSSEQFLYRSEPDSWVDVEAAVESLPKSTEPQVVGSISAAQPLFVLVTSPVHHTDGVGIIGSAYTLIDVAPIVDRPHLESLTVTMHPNASLDLTEASFGEWRANEVVGQSSWGISIADPKGRRSVVGPMMVVGGIGLLLVVIAAVAVYLQTARRETELAFEELQRTADDKDRFLASVSHELRTPLTSVVGLAGVLAEQWKAMDEVEVQAFLDDIHLEGEELADLVEDLLTIGRDESGVLTYDLTQIDMDAEVARVVPRLERSHSVDLQVEETLGRAFADPLRFRQVVRNLLVNACRHADGVVRVEASRRNGMVGLIVSNDGDGIPDSEAGRLFRPYEAGLREGQPGSIGLGLYVSRRLARGMGGDLLYVPHPGMVVFELSLRESADFPMRSAESPGASKAVSRNAEQAS